MTSLPAYIVRRLIFLVFVVLGVTILVFAITLLLPLTTRALLYVSGSPRNWDTEIKTTIKEFGLNDPFYEQYFRWLNQVLHGNLGFSKSGNLPVVEEIRVKWPYTFEIVMFAAPLIIFIGIYLGVQSAIHKDGVIDHASRVFSIVGWSLPSFWLGFMLIAIFSGLLGWLPASGSLTNPNAVYTGGFVRYTGVDIFDGILNGFAGRNTWWISLDAFRHVILPVCVIVTIDVALLIRVMRSSMLEALNKPYITAAKAKGLNKKVVIYKHARRNALIPVATLSGLLVAGLLGGLIITETVFAFNGIGQWAARSAITIDVPAVLGYAMLSAFLFVTANLIVDIFYAYIDPRIRLE
jgi:peptide/nickel transport system permease protein